MIAKILLIVSCNWCIRKQVGRDKIMALFRIVRIVRIITESILTGNQQ